MERSVMELHIRDEGVGPAIVLLHAFPCDGSMWDAQAAALRDSGWRTLVPDLPGFGESTLPPGDPDLEDVARIVADAIAARGVDRYFLGGLSLGGYLSMAWLRVRPQPVLGLLLCDTKASADGEAAMHNRERIAREVLENPNESRDILAEAMMQALLAEDSLADERIVHRVTSWLDSAAPETVAWYQRAMAQRPDSHADLARFAGPALVLRGEFDAMAGPTELVSMQESLAFSTAVEISGAGHLAATERPELVSAVIVEFVTTQGR
ncbi:MAG: alpha/beta hydrolase [Candidatus Nanopelagicales bacterium]|nr:alpha/beta hydrolase [Candidatus Nanopelagicales bacterium]